MGILRGVTYTETDTTWDANRIFGCMCDRKIYKGPKSGNVVIMHLDMHVLGTFVLLAIFLTL